MACVGNVDLKRANLSRDVMCRAHANLRPRMVSERKRERRVPDARAAHAWLLSEAT